MNYLFYIAINGFAKKRDDVGSRLTRLITCRKNWEHKTFVLVEANIYAA
jgi:hypothetical protein